MCGIVGYINREASFKQSEPFVKWFKQALYCDALRGEHGTGILTVNDKGFHEVYKKSLCAADFLELSKTKALTRSASSFMVGHNRWATQGTHTDDNSHPFEEGDIVLFHNGTVSNHRTLNKPTFYVDSHAVAFMFSESDDIKASIERIEGTYSLVWYNATLETLNFARNEDRPMFFGHVKDSKSILFASEPSMIRWLANRNNISLEKIEAVPENFWVEIPLDIQDKVKMTSFTPKVKEVITYPFYNHSKKNVRGSVMEGVFVDLKIQSWTPYNPSITPSVSNIRNGFLSGVFNNLHLNISGISESEGKKYVGKTIKVKVTNVHEDDHGYAVIIPSTSSKNEVVPFLLKGPFNKKVTNKEFDKLTKDGCSYCSSNLLSEEHEKIVWDDQGNPYCEHCGPILTYTSADFN